MGIIGGEYMSAANDVRVKRPFYRRKLFLWPVGIVVLAAIALTLALTVTPRPGALLIRYVFDRGAANTKAALEKHAPQGITKIADQQYRAGDGSAYLDVYLPTTSDKDRVALPTLVWTHGGAWISGDKNDTDPYFRLIASKGYTVISLNYSLAPGKTYPTAVIQINDALAYIQQNATRFRSDVNNVFLAGDSAGAQLTSQIATLTTNPDYAKTLGITPSLKREQLKGVILHCGIYDLHRYLDASGIFGWGTQITVWAYTGSRDNAGNVDLDQMSTINFVTKDFPPAFITGGNGDPLTDKQSKPLADKLTGLGVKTVTLFYPADHEPSLGHEFQFDLDNADGQHALDETPAFMAAHAVKK